MELVLSDDENIILRFDSGEEVVSELTAFVDEHGIDAASVSGIGSAKEVELGFYDLGGKEYRYKSFNEPMEALSISGNVGLLGTNTKVHLHGTFSLSNYQVIGGHIGRIVVNATLELVLDTVGGELKRLYDEGTGLDLLVP